MAALKASLKPQATAKRDGRWRTLDAALLVPGDLVLLGSGASVPADCRINHGQVCVGGGGGAHGRRRVGSVLRRVRHAHGERALA